ncbi:MAG TPA: hypothetical protein VFV90_02965, partial [Usitatibacter sp.]|nr:hypothetical protein [Usitatibacter sp.]
MNLAVQTVLRWASLAGLLALGAAPGTGHAEIKQVLLLQSLNRGSLILDNFTGSFRVHLDQLAGKPVNLVQVVVGPTGSVGAREQALVDYIRSMYGDRPAPDLVVTSGGLAAVFARKHRQQLFPGTPLLLASVDQRYLAAAPLADDETAVSVVGDFPRVVDDILQVLPRTRHVFMVIGSGAIGRFWRRELEAGFSRFNGRVTFTWSDDLSFPAILGRVSALPPDSAILYLLFSADAHGGAYADEQVLAAIRETANAPLFGAHTSLMGYGIVGGTLIPMETIAEQSARVSVRLLNGEPPNRVRTPPYVAGQRTYDWRELRRWQIPQDRLPVGSVVKFRPPDVWEEHKVAIVAAAAALLLQTLLIVWLLYEHRARQRAETVSLRNLALAADASRRETMSALSTSIGHELAQPLGAMLLNVEALRMRLRGKRVSNEELDTVLADVQADATLAAQITDRHRAMLRGRQPDMKRIDLQPVIDQSLALVASEMRARRIEVAVETCAERCNIAGDRVLLQQVLLNL